MHWNGLLIEPDPRNYEIMKSKKRKAKLLQACIIGSKSDNRRRKFRSSTRFSYSSTLEDNGSFLEGDVFYNVECYNINEILNAFAIEKVDFLSLDIDGLELEILESLKNIKDKFDVIILECSYCSSYWKDLLSEKSWNHYRRRFQTINNVLESMGFLHQFFIHPHDAVYKQNSSATRKCI